MSEQPSYEQQAEFHAYSVRQLIAQRARMLAIQELAGLFGGLEPDPPPSGLFASLRKAIITPPPSDVWLRLQNTLKAVHSSPSQLSQDIFCLLFNQGQSGGFFVEFGACDGKLINNTIVLEEDFGWSGILSEPSTQWHERLKVNRRCKIDTRCVWSATGEKVLFSEFFDDSHATESTTKQHGSSGRESRDYEVDTVSLYDLLEHHHAPKHIDMLSIDTEGSEFEILSTFPFDKYTFGFMCIEHRTSKDADMIRDLLHAAGYKQILSSVSQQDGFYIPATHPIFRLAGHM